MTKFLKTSKIASFATIIVAVIGVLTYFGFQPNKSTKSSNTIAQSNIKDTSQLAYPELIIPKSSSRIYLSRTPEEIHNTLQGKTRLQADALIDKAYRGKWTRLKGPISDIIGYVTGTSNVVFKSESGTMVRAFVKKEFRNQLTAVVPGDILTIEGKLASVDAIGIDLEEAELIP